MKDLFNRIKNSGFFIFAIMFLCSVFGLVGAEAIVSAETAGAVTFDQPVSLQYANEYDSDIVKATIEREVVVIKPHLTPLYTIASKRGKTRKGGNPLVEYHEIETLPLATTVRTAYEAPGDGRAQDVIDLTDNHLVSINQTLFFKGIDGYKEDGVTAEGWFQAYVKDQDNSGKPIIVPVNGVAVGGLENTIPSIPANTVVIRGVRTASEKQSRTAPMASVPVKRSQYMQKMILETEETTFFVLAAKAADVKWQKTEITDFAIFEHKLTAEADMLLGKKRKLQIANKFNGNKLEDTYFQEGIWWQPGKDFELPANATRNDLITFVKTAFVGNASSNTKVLLAGSDVVETINKIDYNQVIYPGKPGQAFGLDVQRIIYGQYTLIIINEPAFDDAKMSDCAIVMDEAYLTKYMHDWRSNELDNYRLGTSDSKSQVYIDTFGLVLTNAKAHCRVQLV